MIGGINSRKQGQANHAMNMEISSGTEGEREEAGGERG